MLASINETSKKFIKKQRIDIISSIILIILKRDFIILLQIILTNVSIKNTRYKLNFLYFNC